MNVEQHNDKELGVWSLYLYAMKSRVTWVKYVGTLGKFFDYRIERLNCRGKKKIFYPERGKEMKPMGFQYILRFIQFHLDRVIRKEITSTAVRKHLKRIKLFCEMPDIPIAWKNISRGLPSGKNWLFGADYANT